jgi:hypothetical protein
MEKFREPAAAEVLGDALTIASRMEIPPTPFEKRG